jgi:hypothetical protein
MKLPWNPTDRKTSLIVGAIVLLLIAGLATKCRAESFATFSLGAAPLRGQTSAADLSITYPQAGPGDSSYAVGVTFIGPSTLYGQYQKPNFAWRAELIDGFGKFDVGLGVAYMQNEDIYNSGHAQFTLALSYRFKYVTVGIRHFSNGGTRTPNKGRDLAFIGWRFE